MFAAIDFPQFDPIALQVGPLAIRWYALAYVAGIVLGWLLVRYLAAKYSRTLTRQLVDDFLTYVALGIIVGGRLGYVVGYGGTYFLENPLEIFKVWTGGMAFHGGVIGVLVALFIYCRVHKIRFFEFSDLVCVVVPMGLGFGRLANFINAELWGRKTSVDWAVNFPCMGDGFFQSYADCQTFFANRHPSQLYEAVLEGLVLFVVLLVLYHWKAVRERFGLITAFFAIGYGSFRILVENFREYRELTYDPIAIGLSPQVLEMEDGSRVQLVAGVVLQGAELFGFPKGQVYSVPMILAGLVLIVIAMKLYNARRD